MTATDGCRDDRSVIDEPRERVIGTRRRKGVGATILRRSIPIRTFGDWKNPEPGYMKADLVAHCGGSMAGSVVHTLVLTDIATGWTECVPLIARDQALIVEALKRIRKTLPFPLRGFDTDNDGAFINQTVHSYCQETLLEFTRSRPYRKNDQAWVEQKNGAAVRKLAGYDRLSGIADAEKLARLYEFSRFYVNCFQPSFKLKTKVRMGARVVKTYHPPLTPYERVVRSPQVPQSGKQRLQAIFAKLDPIALIQNIRGVQEELVVGKIDELGRRKSESAESFLRSYGPSGNWVRCGPRIGSTPHITGALGPIHLRVCGPEFKNNSSSLLISLRRNSFANFERNIPAIFLMVRSGPCDVESRSGDNIQSRAARRVRDSAATPGRGDPGPE